MQVRIVNGQGEDGGIKATFAKLAQDLLGLFLDQQQFQARVTLADARHHMWQEVGSKGRKDAKAQAAGFRIQRAPRDFSDLLDFGQHLACAFDDFLANLGEQHLARRALHERDAEFFLQLHDLGGKGGLAYKNRVGSPPEMLVLGQSDQISKITQVHGV
jgi:hypothetical protein